MSYFERTDSSPIEAEQNSELHRDVHGSLDSLAAKIMLKEEASALKKIRTFSDSGSLSDHLKALIGLQVDDQYAESTESRVAC
jgi:hypothetical protein